MTKDKGMTKSQAQNTCKDYDPFWDNGDTALVREEAGGKRVYDLEERTARFGEAVSDFAKTIPQNSVTNRLINQLVGAGTSVGGELCRSRRCSVEEGIFEKHRDMQERDA
jgi:hypothetical protein